MTVFQLKIITADGILFDGPVEELIVRTLSGDLGILAGHTNYAAALGEGQALLVTGENKRRAVCAGGMLTVMNGKVTLLPERFSWEDQ